MANLNKKSAEKLASMIRDGLFIDKPWKFDADASNVLLGNPPNWTTFQDWFLGIDETLPKDTKDRFSFPFTSDGTKVNLQALRLITKSARASGDGDIADFASEQLGVAKAKISDQARASGELMTFQADVRIKAAKDVSTCASVSILAYSGGLMTPAGFGLCAIDYNGLELGDSVNILADHDPKISGVVGAGVPQIADGKLTVTGQLAKSSPAVQQIIDLARAGVRFGASVGVAPTSTERVTEAKVNGRVLKAKQGFTVVRAGVLKEISIVALPADSTTTVAIAASRRKIMSTTIDNELASDQDAATAERSRVSAIMRLGTKYPGNKGPEIMAKAADEGWSVDKCELELIRASRSPIGGGGGAYRSHGDPTNNDVINASACLAAGISPTFLEKTYDKRTIDAAMSGPNRGVTISTIMRQTMLNAGMTPPMGTFRDGDIRATFEADRIINQDMLRASGGTGGYSTMSLSGITENILNKAMLESYAAVGSIVPDVCYETDTNDFKTFKRYRLTTAGIFSVVGSAGELKNVSLQDESYPNQVTTQGVILNVTRDVLINDDMGALTQAPTLLGRGAAMIRELGVCSALLNGTDTQAPGATLEASSNTNLQSFNFFSATAGNLLTGGSSALSISSMTTAVQKMREQVDTNSMPIMLTPDRIIVPPALEATALALFGGANLVVNALQLPSSSSGTSASQASSVLPDNNPYRGRFRVLVSPFLSAAVATKLQSLKSSYPNGSDTGWLLLGNPSGGYAPVQVGYLRGQRTPIIERGEANFNTLGISMRCYYDFGVALHDYRTAVYSAGV